MQGEPVEEPVPSGPDMLHEFNARLVESETVPEARREVRHNANSTRPQPPTESEVELEDSRRILRTRSRPQTGGLNTELEQLDDEYRPPTKRRRITEGGKRSKSSRLPLERVPENQQMHRLVLESKVSLRDITNDLDRFNRYNIMSIDVPWDCDADSACNASTFDGGFYSNEFKVWSRRIKGSLEKKLKRLEEGGDEEEVLTCIGALSRLERVKRGMGVEVEGEDGA